MDQEVLEAQEHNFQYTIRQLTAEALGISEDILDDLVSKISTEEFELIRHYLINEDLESKAKVDSIINKYNLNE